METVYRDYRDKVNFFYVYKSVAHPEINNFVPAFNIEERLKHVARAKQMLKTEIPWICDNMENSVRNAFGAVPNGEFVIDPDGKIVRKRFWSNPDVLRKDMEELIGPVDKITKVEDLPARLTVKPRKIASGVVPRIVLPGGLEPLRFEPVPDKDNPFFAKLRIEGTQGTFNDEGMGQLYLGVYLDPLYDVHWNNRAGRIKIEFETSDEVYIKPETVEGPEVKEDADVDPRQFLVKVDRGIETDPIIINLTYTVCDDAETFCKEIKQSYKVYFKSNRSLGSRPGRFFPGLFAKVRELDKNGDGNLTKDELPEGQVTLYIGHMDYNANGVIEKAEIDNFLKMFNNGSGFDTEYDDGKQPEKDDESEREKDGKDEPSENAPEDDDG